MKKLATVKSLAVFTLTALLCALSVGSAKAQLVDNSIPAPTNINQTSVRA